MNPITSLAKSFANDPKEAQNFLLTCLEKAKSDTQNIWIQLIDEAQLLKMLSELTPDMPLYGIPFAIKDNIDLVGFKTTCACPEFAFLPEKSSSVVQKFMSLGAIPLGKTNMDQFATGLVGTRSPHGICGNPTAPGFISGGSSSGSASAISAGHVIFGLGTDTAGSGRVPAAVQGLIGVKGSKGVISTAGVFPACRSLDCLTILAKDLDSAEYLFEVAHFYDEADIYSREKVVYPIKKNVKVGTLNADDSIFLFDESYEIAYEEFKNLSSIDTEEIDYSVFDEAAKLLYEGPWLAERYHPMQEFFETNSQHFQEVTRKIMSPAAELKAYEVYRSMDRLQALKQKADKIFESIDALILPSIPGMPTVSDVQNEPILVNSQVGTYTNFVNLLDLCALTIPFGKTPSGYPASLTLIAQKFQEEQLFVLARQIQAEDRKTKLAVFGLHLRGQKLNYQLIDRGAEFVASSYTSEDYKMVALPGGKPAVFPVSENKQKVYCEIFSLSEASLSSFLKLIPSPLGLGKIQLESGKEVLGFISTGVLTGYPEIESGNWLEHMSQSMR